MQLRKLLVASAAVAAAGAMALAPAVQADSPTGGDIGSVAVNGSTATADYDMTLTAKTPLSVTMKVFGSDTKLGCTSGSATGEVHAGSPAPSPFMTFDSLTLNCDSFIPGQTVVISVPSNGCANVDLDDDNVHDGLGTGDTIDTGLDKTAKVSAVDGTFNVIYPCLVTVSAGICSITLEGSTGVQFDEAIKSTSPITQELVLKDNGLMVRDVGALCFGAVSTGDRLVLNNVRFNVTLDDGAGAIDVRDTP